MFRLDHIQLAIPPGSENECRAFWIETLGFSELPRPEALRARGGCWLARDGVELHLGVQAQFAPAKKAHPAFAVAGLDALADALAKSGRPERWDDAIRGRRRFFTEDPFGNRIEFMEDVS